MKIHRSHPESGFTIIPNDTARDPRLSYRARGVLAELLSRPDGWQETADRTGRRAKLERGKAGEGRDTIRAVYIELEAAGYLYRDKHRGERGRVVTDLHVFDAEQELDDGGTPIYFRLLADITAGRTDDDPSSRRSHLQEREFPQVAPTTEIPGVGGPVVSKKTVNEDCTDEKYPGSAVNSSVEVSSNGEVTFNLHTRSGTDKARQAQAAALNEWIRQHPETSTEGTRP